MALELSELARDKGRYDAIHGLLFAAYFEEGKHISDLNMLGDIAEKAGLDRNEALAALKDGTYRHRLDASLDEGRSLMISAVPTFIFSDGGRLTGAQPLERFRAVLSGADADRPRFL
jgi:predicted DsbA family dithiol-disulfide isomerase